VFDGALCRCKEALFRDVFAVTDTYPLRAMVKASFVDQDVVDTTSPSRSTNTMAMVARNGTNCSTSAAYR
jgi:hypothetical protein